MSAEGGFLVSPPSICKILIILQALFCLRGPLWYHNGMLTNLPKEIVDNHKTEEVIAWSVLELGRAKIELQKNPDTFATGRYAAEVDRVYEVLQQLANKLSPALKVVS